jgi:hypothetical protein
MDKEIKRYQGGLKLSRSQAKGFSLVSYFTYRLDPMLKSTWHTLRYFPIEIERSSVNRYRKSPILHPSKPADGLYVYLQNNLYAYSYGFDLPRELAPMGDPLPSPPMIEWAKYVREKHAVYIKWREPEIACKFHTESVRYKLEVELYFSKLLLPSGKVISVSQATNKLTRGRKKPKKDHRKREIFIFESPCEGMFRFTNFASTSSSKFFNKEFWLSDVYEGVLRLQMQTCVLYKNPPSYKFNHRRGVVVSVPSNLYEVIIIND